MRTLCTAKILSRHAHFRCLITRKPNDIIAIVRNKFCMVTKLLPSSPKTSGEKKEVIFIDPEALDLLAAINK